MRTNCGCSRRRTPSSGHRRRSFSSALLEATYRSMDEEYGVPPAGSPTTRGPEERRAPSARAANSARSTPSLFLPFPDPQASLPSPLPLTTSKPVPAGDMPGRKPRKSQQYYTDNRETTTEGKLPGQSVVSPSARLASLLIKLLPAARHRKKKAKNPAHTGSDHSGAKTLRRGRDAAKRYVCFYPVVGEETPGARVVKGPPRKRTRAGGAARELVRRFTARKGVGERKSVAGDDGRSSCASSSELFELESLGEPAAVLGGRDRLFH